MRSSDRGLGHVPRESIASHNDDFTFDLLVGVQLREESEEVVGVWVSSRLVMGDEHES